MTINSKKQTIEMSKKFAAAAHKYGTPEYVQLQEVRRDYPNFKEVIATQKVNSKKDLCKGLTYEYMEKYIKVHDEDGSIMDEYMMLRGLTKEALEALAEPCTYQEMRNWFLNKFPAIAEFHKKRAALLSAA